MRAILHTLCGCSKEVDVPGHGYAPDHPRFKVAIASRYTAFAPQMSDAEIARISYRVREFEFIYFDSGPYGAAHFREIV